MGARDRLAEMNNVLYLCDGRACESPNYCAHNGTGECRHTTRLEHALHPDIDLRDFIMRPGRKEGQIDLWEPYDE